MAVQKRSEEVKEYRRWRRRQRSKERNLRPFANSTKGRAPGW